MMLEYKVESLNTCIHELQQQTCAQRLELEDAHHGYLESRLQEELVMKEKAFRGLGSSLRLSGLRHMKLKTSAGPPKRSDGRCWPRALGRMTQSWMRSSKASRRRK